MQINKKVAFAVLYNAAQLANKKGLFSDPYLMSLVNSDANTMLSAFVNDHAANSKR